MERKVVSNWMTTSVFLVGSHRKTLVFKSDDNYTTTFCTGQAKKQPSLLPQKVAPKRQIKFKQS